VVPAHELRHHPCRGVRLNHGNQGGCKFLEFDGHGNSCSLKIRKGISE
jgi:hypothetical protein